MEHLFITPENNHYKDASNELGSQALRAGILDQRIEEIEATIVSNTPGARRRDALKRGISISIHRTEGPIRASRRYDG